MHPKPRLGAILLMVMGLSACGVAVPQIKEPYEPDLPPSDPSRPKLSGSAVLEFEVKRKVFCELRDAVREALTLKLRTGPSLDREVERRNRLLPLDWIAELSLSFQVDEASALNPGVVLNTPLPNALAGFGGAAGPSGVTQAFGLGLGANLSSTATRTDKFDPYYTIEYLAQPIAKDSACHPENDPILRKYGHVPSGPFLVDGDLGIKDWLLGSLVVSRFLDSVGTASQVVGAGGNHPDALTLEIKFVVVSAGSVTPSWRLLRVSADTGGSPLLALSRTRTHDLILTIGPSKKDTNNAHLASLIGNAVANANRAVVSP